MAGRASATDAMVGGGQSRVRGRASCASKQARTVWAPRREPKAETRDPLRWRAIGASALCSLPHAGDARMETLSRREEEALVKTTKQKALKECDPVVKGARRVGRVLRCD